MAGDWIKFEHATPDKPEVAMIAEDLSIDPDAVTGKLIRLWVWADQQTINGNAPSVPLAFLDRLVFCPGFCKALQKVGWIQLDEGRVNFPNFGIHNGSSAKKRALTARRKASCKARQSEIDENPQGKAEGENREKPPRKSNAPSVPRSDKNGTQEALPIALPREEKRREENNTPQSPPRGVGDEWDRILPSGSQNLTKTDQQRRTVKKNSGLMIRVGGWFKKRPETLWSIYDARALRDLSPIPEEDLELMETYYTSGTDFLRRDIKTLLNNWRSELDRAVQYKHRKNHDSTHRRNEGTFNAEPVLQRGEGVTSI